MEPPTSQIIRNHKNMMTFLQTNWSFCRFRLAQQRGSNPQHLHALGIYFRFAEMAGLAAAMDNDLEDGEISGSNSDSEMGTTRNDRSQVTFNDSKGHT